MFLSLRMAYFLPMFSLIKETKSKKTAKNIHKQGTDTPGKKREREIKKNVPDEYAAMKLSKTERS